MVRENILIIDDEKNLLELINFNLAKEGFNIMMASSGFEAFELIKSGIPDLILLDLMLPDMDGLDICRILKSNTDTKHIPVIMISAKADESDIVAGLTLGAEDYVTKPFSLKVLTARIKTVLRRKKELVTSSNKFIKIQDLEIDPYKYEVMISKEPVDLTNLEFRTLSLLASNPGRVYTRDQIINAIHDDSCSILDRSVDALIVGLRKKLDIYSSFIETVWGVGYRFKE